MAKRALRIGNTGEDVKELQTALAALGYLTITNPDGIFGVMTGRAVLAFQRARGLVEDAVCGAKTWAALDEAHVQHPAVELAHALDPYRSPADGVEPPARPLNVPAEDPGAPYLLFDLYPLDLDDPRTAAIEDPPFARVFGKPGMVGGVLKATDGMGWAEKYAAWFGRNFRALRTVAGESYARTWFRGAYHYLQFLADGRAQADVYCDAVEKAGGWDDGVIMPIVDIEFGGERMSNRRATNQQIVDCTSSFSARCKERTSRRVMLYGRGALRDREIASRLGCDVVWNPAYTENMVTNGLVSLNGKPGPWKLEDIALWQYGGDGGGDADVHKLPLEIAGFGKVDMSVHICGNKPPTIQTLRAAII